MCSSNTARADDGHAKKRRGRVSAGVSASASERRLSVMLLVSGKHRPAYDGYNIGHLVCPRSRNTVWSAKWAADNSAFSGFDEPAWLRMLDRIAHKPGCLFVTVPDWVGNASRTLALYHRYVQEVTSRGLPPAYVLQDGLGHTPGVPNSARAVFVGGTTEWKLGPVARAFAQEAKRRGLWVHMGRVNSARRLRYAQSIGVDSVDGSGFARFPDAMLPRFCRVAQQPPLAFGEVA